jgi:hypothetical protein
MGVAVPVLISYAVWLAAQAPERGLALVLRLAGRRGPARGRSSRPGRLCSARRVPVPVRLTAVVLLAGSTLCEDVLSTWLAPKPGSSLRAALLRAALDVEDVRRTVDAAWADPAKLDERLSSTPLQASCEICNRSRSVAGAAGGATGRRAGAIPSARWRGSASTPRCAGGLGWRGHSARAFDRLVSRLGDARSSTCSSAPTQAPAPCAVRLTQPPHRRGSSTGTRGRS